MRSGQPVTFTDFFGMLIGQTLLGAKVSFDCLLHVIHIRKNSMAGP